MRILLLSWNFPPTLGGMEYVVENLFLGLMRRGHEVEAVAPFAAAGPEEPPNVHRARRAGLAAYVLFALRQGAALCRKARPEIIVCGSVVPAPAAYVLSLLYGCPYVVFVHGSDLLQSGFIYQRAIRFLLARAGRIAANSAQTRSLLETHGFRTGPVDVVHPGVKVEAFAEEPADAAAEILREVGSRRVLLSVGRLIRRKGHLPFIEQVMPRLVQRFPDLLFLVVGEDATQSLVHAERLRDRIAERVEALGLQNHVRLLGRLRGERDLVKLFFRADLFVLPGLDLPDDMEGFGIVFMEAALGRTPTVATRVGGVPEAVVDGQTGLLVPPGDADAMVEAVSRLLSDDALRERMGRAAEARARREFSWETICAKYEETFQRCVETRGARKGTADA